MEFVGPKKKQKTSLKEGQTFPKKKKKWGSDQNYIT